MSNTEGELVNIKSNSGFIYRAPTSGVIEWEIMCVVMFSTNSFQQNGTTEHCKTQTIQEKLSGIKTTEHSEACNEIPRAMLACVVGF